MLTLDGKGCEEDLEEKNAAKLNIPEIYITGPAVSENNTTTTTTTTTTTDKVCPRWSWDGTENDAGVSARRVLVNLRT